jgi:hypothetical protein
MRAAIIAIVFAVSALVSWAARADLMVKSQESGIELRLLDAPCTHAQTLAGIKEEWRPKFRNARIMDGRGTILHYGCWVEHDAEIAFIMFDDGSSTGMSLASFRDSSI